MKGLASESILSCILTLLTSLCPTPRLDIKYSVWLFLCKAKDYKNQTEASILNKLNDTSKFTRDMEPNIIWPSLIEDKDSSDSEDNEG